VATIQEVDDAIAMLLARLSQLDDGARSLMPTDRVIEARCPDLDYVRFARWRQGRLLMLEEPPDHRADIRISVRSDDLIAMVAGDLPFSRAYTSNRVRLDASMTDLLRLRTLL
jgi:hypothetical protein